MTADQIRGITFNANRDISGYNKIQNSIHEAAQKGEYSIWWYADIDKYAREQLTLDGFKVGETRHDRNESLTEISWHAK